MHKLLPRKKIFQNSALELVQEVDYRLEEDLKKNSKGLFDEIILRRNGCKIDQNS